MNIITDKIIKECDDCLVSITEDFFAVVQKPSKQSVKDPCLRDELARVLHVSNDCKECKLYAKKIIIENKTYLEMDKLVCVYSVHPRKPPSGRGLRFNNYKKYGLHLISATNLGSLYKARMKKERESKDSDSNNSNTIYINCSKDKDEFDSSTKNILGEYMKMINYDCNKNKDSP